MLYTFGNNIFKPTDIFPIKERDVLTMIRISEKNKWLIEDIRKSDDPIEIKKLKEKLPYFCVSRFTDKKHRDCFLEAQGFILDIDKIDFVDHYKQVLSEIPLVRFIFASPQGNGLKVGIHTEQCIYTPEMYSEAYKAFVDLFEKKTGLICDHTSDCARACFVSYDPNCYYNPKSIPWKIKIPPKPQVQYNVDDLPLDIENLKKLAINAKIPDYHEWIKAGMSLKTIGPDGLKLFKLLSLNKGYDDTEEEVEKKWASFSDDPMMTIGTFIFIALKYGGYNE